MNPAPPHLESDRKRAERQKAAMDKTAIYNTDASVWGNAARYYRKRPDGGPTFRVLEGNVWGVPKAGWVARFKSTEESRTGVIGCGFQIYSRRKRLQGVSTGPQPDRWGTALSVC